MVQPPLRQDSVEIATKHYRWRCNSSGGSAISIIIIIIIIIIHISIIHLTVKWGVQSARGALAAAMERITCYPTMSQPNTWMS